jgi:Uma2 family endonuclease
MNALAQIHPPFTSAEFYKMAARGAFAGFRVELRRGMIVKMSPKHLPHASIQADLMFAINDATKRAGLAWRIVNEVTVNFGGGFEPMPDLVVLDPSLIQDLAGPVPPGAVKLIVEVGDATIDDDMGEKREDYARAGVAEYWVADVKAKQVIRHTSPKDGKFQVEERIALSEPIAMLTVPAVVAKIG